MKKFACILLVFLSIFCKESAAQLSDTKWRGTFNIPDPTECYFDFRKDTVDLIVEESGNSLETMRYKLSGDTITFIKLYGSSPCTEEPGIYTFVLQKNTLKLTLVSDNCSARAHAGLDSELSKIIEQKAVKKDD